MGLIMHKGVPYGGGSDVVPNPQDAATDELEKLGVDGDVYEVTDADYRSNMHTYTETGYSTSTHKFDGAEISMTYAVKSVFSPLARVFNALKTAINDHASVFTTISNAISSINTALESKVDKNLVYFNELSASGRKFGINTIIYEYFTAGNDTYHENNNLTAIKSVVNNLADYTEENVQVESLSDTTPYLYRQSPAIGTRVMENALVGASVVKNQLASLTGVRDNGQWSSETVTSLGNGKYRITFSGNETTRPYLLCDLASNSFNWIAGHKYLFVPNLKISNGSFASDIAFSYRFRQSDTSEGRDTFSVGGNNCSPAIVSATKSLNLNRIDIYGTSTTQSITSSTVIELQPYVIDLTQWFGSTIADNAYTKEQSTAGSGIAWLKSQGHDFSKYIPHNTGTLESVDPSGKNVYDENNVLKATYSISQSPLRGIPKLVNDAIVYDGDVRKSDGSTDKNYGIVVLNGSEDWRLSSSTSNNCYILDDDSLNIASINGNYYGKIICDKLDTITYTQGYQQNTYQGIAVGSGSSSQFRISLLTSVVNRNLTAFKTWLAANPQTVVYALRNPYTESLPPYTNPQKSLVGGTEEWITTNDVPVGHQSEYKSLPVLFDDDYIQTIAERAENAASKVTPYLQIMDNNVATDVNNYRIYFHSTSTPYALVNKAEMLRHRFLFVELFYNNGTPTNRRIISSALIDPNSLDGYYYEIEISNNDTLEFESYPDTDEFAITLFTTGSYNDGDPTNYYLTIRLVD